jgi:phage terminase small subunit
MPRTPTGLPRGARPTLTVRREPLTRIPTPPADLDAIGERLWAAIWTAGRWLLHVEADAFVVERIARKGAEIARLDAFLATHSGFYESRTGVILAHPAVAQRRAAEAQLVAWLSLIGLEPSTRATMNLNLEPEVDALLMFRSRNPGRRKQTSPSVGASSSRGDPVGRS